MPNTYSRQDYERRCAEVRLLGLYDDTFNPEPWGDLLVACPRNDPSSGEPAPVSHNTEERLGLECERGQALLELEETLVWGRNIAQTDEITKLFEDYGKENVETCLRWHRNWLDVNPDATTPELRRQRHELLDFVDPILRKAYEATKAKASAQANATGKWHSIVEAGEAGRLPQVAIEWMAQSACEVQLKKGLLDLCDTVRRFLQDAHCQKHFGGDDKDKLEMAVKAVDRWWFGNEGAGNVDFEAKHRELDGVATPIMTRVRHKGGGMAWLSSAPAPSRPLPVGLVARGSEPSGACPQRL